MNKLIGCCGLDCEKCDARIATIANDNALREKTAALWTKLNGVMITPEMINCTGCRIEGAKRRSATSYAQYITALGRREWIPAPIARRWTDAAHLGTLPQTIRRCLKG